MKSIEPTFTFRKKTPTDKIGRVCTFITYTLKKGDSKRVYFTLRDMTTGQPFKIRPNQWNKSKSCCNVVGTSAEREYLTTINTQIKEIQLAVAQIVKECAEQHTNVSSQLFSSDNIYDRVKSLDLFEETPDVSKSDSLSRYWAEFITKAENAMVTHNGKRYKKTAIMSYKKCLNAFKDFEKRNKHKYSFDEIDASFYDSFVTDMYKAGKMANTVGERIKNLKALMNRAYEEGLHTNTAYRSFTKPEENVDNVYLSEKELDKLYSFEFSPRDKYLEKYRDLFLVGCYSGLRWGDFSVITKDDFKQTAKGYTVLRIKASKTGSDIVVPIIWRNFRSILEKYNYDLPRVTGQKFNKYIKEACRLAGIDERVKISSGKYQRDEPYEKWELVSSHTARRSACTNMYLKGIPTISIMKISGHTKESTFMKYIKVTLEENAERVAEEFGEKD